MPNADGELVAIYIDDLLRPICSIHITSVRVYRFGHVFYYENVTIPKRTDSKKHIYQKKIYKSQKKRKNFTQKMIFFHLVFSFQILTRWHTSAWKVNLKTKTVLPNVIPSLFGKFFNFWENLQFLVKSLIFGKIFNF